jgi:hypothetical protein
MNTNFVEDEPDVFNKFNRCLGYVWDLDKCYKHFSIKIPYRTCLINSIINMFLCKLVLTDLHEIVYM